MSGEGVCSSLVPGLVELAEKLLSAETLKSYENLLSIIQVFAANNCFTSEQLTKVVTLIAESISKFGNEADVIKILQVLLIVLNSDSVTINSLCLSVYTICLYSFNMKSFLFWNTAISVLRQMYSLLFPLLSAETEDANLLCVCFCQLDKLEELVHNRHKYIQAIGIDFLFLIFNEHGPSIASARMSEEYFGKLCGGLLELLTDLATDLPLLVRAVKLSASAVKLSPRFGDLLVPMFAWVSSPVAWKKYLLLEVFRELLGSAQAVVLLSARAVDTSKLHPIKEIISRMLKIRKMAMKLPKKSSVKSLSILNSVKTLGDISDSILHKTPTIFREQLNLMLIHTVSRLIKTAKEILALEQIPMNASSNAPFTSRQSEIIVSPLRDSWDELCELLAYLLNEVQAEDTVQSTLALIHSSIKIAGRLNLIPQVNKLLKKLCMLSLPQHFSTPLNHH